MRVTDAVFGFSIVLSNEEGGTSLQFFDTADLEHSPKLYLDGTFDGIPVPVVIQRLAVSLNMLSMALLEEPERVVMVDSRSEAGGWWTAAGLDGGKVSA